MKHKIPSRSLKEAFSGNSVKISDCRAFSPFKTLPGCRVFRHSGPKKEHLAEKRSFEDKCEILRTISQPRTLSAGIPASQKGVYLFYNPPINFHFAIDLSPKWPPKIQISQYDWGYIPSHTNVCKFFNFQLTFSQLILHPKC